MKTIYTNDMKLTNNIKKHFKDLNIVQKVVSGTMIVAAIVSYAVIGINYPAFLLFVLGCLIAYEL